MQRVIARMWNNLIALFVFLVQSIFKTTADNQFENVASHCVVSVLHLYSLLLLCVYSGRLSGLYIPCIAAAGSTC